MTQPASTPHKWIRPVIIIAAAMVLIAVVLVTRPANESPSPKELAGMMEKAGTPEVQSYRMTWSGTSNDRSEASGSQQEGAFAAPDRYYLKITEGGAANEFITIGDAQYVTSDRFSPNFITAFTNSASRFLTHEFVLESLNALLEPKGLRTETINGVACFYYRGTLDLERQIKEMLASVNTTRPGHEEQLEFMETEFERIRQSTIEYEIWVGKEDLLTRQIKYSGRVPSENEGEWDTSNTTIQIYDINQPVTIEAPLDASGGLLPGWDEVTNPTPPYPKAVPPTRPVITHTPVPVEDMSIPIVWAKEEAPDDVMPAPGIGPAYRANIISVKEDGTHVENPWPPVEVSSTKLGSGPETAHVTFREYVETAAGETRNNIIKATISGGEFDSVGTLSLYADDVPAGITLTVGTEWSGPFSRAEVLVMEIAPDIATGKYPLEIGLLINGKDYGTVPCTLDVEAPAAIRILPALGSYLSDMSGEVSSIILEDVHIETGICNEDYWATVGPDLKKGDPCLIVSGHVRNQDEGKFEIAMAAGGFDASGERVAWTLDAAHIVGAIGLHLEHEETGEFTMHLNPSDDLKTIRIYAANSLITPP